MSDWQRRVSVALSGDLGRIKAYLREHPERINTFVCLSCSLIRLWDLRRGQQFVGLDFVTKAATF